VIYCEDCDKQISLQLDACPDCNKPLQQLCCECNVLYPLSANFCSNCGNQLVNVSTPSLKDNLQLSTGRRHITVLFCDLVGSTELSTQLDPEDLSDLLVKYRNLCMRIVKKWDGYVADFQGDGVMIYFGYPVAHEDDSKRAVHAALEITEQVKNINFQSGQAQIELAVRIGINSGRAVIGDIGRSC